jgi:hypothetical protein
MEKYIAVVKTDGKAVTKYQDFSNQTDADAHASKYGGFVAEKPDSDFVEYWVVDGEKLTFDKTSSDNAATQKAAIAYQRARRKSYPSIGDQLDAIWKGGDDQAAMKVIVDKVKSDNPKPE